MRRRVLGGGSSGPVSHDLPNTGPIETLSLFCGFYAEDAKAISVFALHLLYPWLNVVIPHLLVGFFARILKDQKAIWSTNVAFEGDSFVVTACDQFTAARLDSFADL